MLSFLVFTDLAHPFYLETPLFLAVPEDKAGRAVCIIDRRDGGRASERRVGWIVGGGVTNIGVFWLHGAFFFIKFAWGCFET